MLNLKTKSEAVKSRRKVKLSFYPYTYVRSIVMRTLLLKKHDYDKLLKMDFNEIAGFLQETNYKNEIDRYAGNFSGAELLEKSINENLAQSFKKLRRISSDELRGVIDEYLRRKDIENIKTILRGKLINAEKSFILNSIVDAGTLSMDYYDKLANQKSIKDILENLEIADFDYFESAYKDFSGKNNLDVIENSLDKFYYQGMIDLSKRIPKQGSILRDFLAEEIKVLNLMTLLRLKKAKIESKEAEKYVFYFGDKKYDILLKQIVDAKSIEDVESILNKTEFSETIRKGFESFRKTGSLIEIESMLKKFLLKKLSLLAHKNILSIDTILGYMFAKDIEARNLRILIKGKQLGMSNDFIENQMVV